MTEGPSTGPPRSCIPSREPFPISPTTYSTEKLSRDQSAEPVSIVGASHDSEPQASRTLGRLMMKTHSTLRLALILASFSLTIIFSFRPAAQADGLSTGGTTHEQAPTSPSPKPPAPSSTNQGDPAIATEEGVIRDRGVFRDFRKQAVPFPPLTRRTSSDNGHSAQEHGDTQRSRQAAGTAGVGITGD